MGLRLAIWYLEPPDWYITRYVVHALTKFRLHTVYNSIYICTSALSICTCTQSSANVVQCVAIIVQHPPCHVWPAFQGAEHSSMQSLSLLDADQPAPGLRKGGEGTEGVMAICESKYRIGTSEISASRAVGMCVIVGLTFNDCIMKCYHTHTVHADCTSTYVYDTV